MLHDNLFVKMGEWLKGKGKRNGKEKNQAFEDLRVWQQGIELVKLPFLYRQIWLRD